jgi:small multidrug resistance family-3 protein
MTSLSIFVLAALAEIAGCYAVWIWARQGASALWLLPGAVCLGVFAWMLTRSDAAFAGRAFAAYGGVYIAVALGWLWLAEGRRPDAWDVLGGAVCLAGAAIILLMPRGG